MFLFRTITQKLLRCLIVLALLPISGSSQTAVETARLEPILPFTQFTLDNGLTVIVREDDKLPIASVTVIYNVGSRFDPPGRNGMAHLFEHLLFYGSLHVPRNFFHAQWQGGPLVVASLIVRGGAGVDPQDKQGLARLTASLLTAGRMSEEQLTDALARLDATLQATTAGAAFEVVPYECENEEGAMEPAE